MYITWITTHYVSYINEKSKVHVKLLKIVVQLFIYKITFY